jgi:hypothetical protein
VPTVSSRSIPRVSGEEAQQVSGTTVTWSSLVPSFLKKNYKGEIPLFQGFSRDERKAEKLRDQIFKVAPERSSDTQQEYFDALEAVSDPEKLNGILAVGEKIARTPDLDFPHEGYLALIRSGDGVLGDVIANLDYVTKGYNNLNRVIGVRGDLIDKYGVTPDENGLIPTLAAHNEVRDYLLNSPFFSRNVHYLGSSELVKTVQEQPEEVPRVIDYFKSYVRKPGRGEDVRSFEYDFDPEHFKEYMNTHDALGSGVL